MVKVFPDLVHALVACTLVLLGVDEEERARIYVVDLLEIDFPVIPGTAAVREDAALAIELVLAVLLLVLQDHVVDQTLVLSEVLFNGLLNERLLHPQLGGVDGHVIVEELESVVHETAHACLSLDALAH
mgnify:CR=1 FL=1